MLFVGHLTARLNRKGKTEFNERLREAALDAGQTVVVYDTKGSTRYERHGHLTSVEHKPYKGFSGQKAEIIDWGE